MHSPRNYQLKACDVAASSFAAGKRAHVSEGPCGSGKTTTIAEGTRRAHAKGRRVIIAAHRRRLIQQLAERLKLFSIPYGVIMADLPDEPWAVVNSSASVQVASQQTLFSRRDRAGIPRCDLLIPDECHNLTQAMCRDVWDVTGYRWMWGHSATPCNGDGSGLGQPWDSLHSVTTIQELITDGLLTAVKTFGPLKMMERRKKGQRTGIAGDPVQQWFEFAEGLRTVVFSATVKESIAVRDAYMKAMVPAAHVDAHTPHEERSRIYSELAAGRIMVVSSVGLLKEGVDIPELECCQLLTAAVSPRIFWQGVGRIQRICNGKTKAVLLDHSGATAIHGLPNTSPVWTLAESDSVQAREREKQKNDPNCRPRMCRQCGAISAGSGKCPECGALLVHIVRADVTTERENLQEVNGETTKSAAEWSNVEAPQKEWVQLLYIGAAKRMTCAQVAAIFKGKFGQWPNAAGVRPVPAFGDNKLLIRDVFPQFLRKAASS